MHEELTKEMYSELVDKLNLRDPEKWDVHMAAHGPFAIHDSSMGFWDTVHAGVCYFTDFEKAYVLRLYKEHCSKEGSTMQEELTKEMYFELVDKLNLREGENWDRWMLEEWFLAADHSNSSRYNTTLREVMPYFDSKSASLLLSKYKEHCVPKPSESHYTLDKALEEYGAKYEQSPVVALLAEDPKFKAAAEKLAAKLLHAMMKAGRGQMVHRRDKQSPVLFHAACVLLARACVGLGMGTRGCWLTT
jgi:hypothetical protein